MEGKVALTDFPLRKCQDLLFLGWLLALLSPSILPQGAVLSTSVEVQPVLASLFLSMLTKRVIFHDERIEDDVRLVGACPRIVQTADHNWRADPQARVGADRDWWVGRWLQVVGNLHDDSFQPIDDIS